MKRSDRARDVGREPQPSARRHKCEMGTPALSYRLQRCGLWLTLGAAATVLGAVVFARAWTWAPDRPWFPLLFVITLALGGSASSPMDCSG